MQRLLLISKSRHGVTDAERNQAGDNFCEVSSGGVTNPMGRPCGSRLRSTPAPFSRAFLDAGSFPWRHYNPHQHDGREAHKNNTEIGDVGIWKSSAFPCLRSSNEWSLCQPLPRRAAPKSRCRCLAADRQSSALQLAARIPRKAMVRRRERWRTSEGGNPVTGRDKPEAVRCVQPWAARRALQNAAPSVTLVPHFKQNIVLPKLTT